MEKKISLLIALLLLLSGVFSSCRPAGTAESTTVLTDTAETTENEPEKKNVYIPTEAVTLIETIEDDVPQTAAISSELFLEVCGRSKNDYSYEYETCLKMINLRTGETVSEAVFDGRLNLSPNACDENTVALSNFSGENYVVCNADFSEKRDIPYGAVDYEPALFSGSRFIRVQDGCLMIKTGDKIPQSLTNLYSIPVNITYATSAGRDEVRFATKAEIGAKNYDYDVHININTGEITALYPDSTGLWMHGENRYYRVSSFNYNTPTLDFTDGDGNIYHYKLNEYGDNTLVTYVENSPYFALMTPGGEVHLCLAEEDCTVTDYTLRGLPSVRISAARYIKDSGCIVLVLCEREPKNGCSIYLVNPALLKGKTLGKAQPFDGNIIDESVLSEFKQNTAIPQCPDYLSDVRKKADSIEEKYGITILLSEQCRTVCEQIKSRYKEYEGLRLTNSDGNRDSEKEMLSEFLTGLDEVFGKFPKGMLRQFRDVNGKAGIRIVPVSRITAEDTADGLTDWEYGWYNIYMQADARGQRLDGIICHELWHAVESKIYFSDAELLSDEKWNALNPVGFSYNSEEYEGETQYVFGENTAENVYFAESYGQTSVHEDKATIFEAVTENNKNRAKEMLLCPHILAKYNVMCDAIRNSFDTSGWGTPVWEE